MSQKTVTVGEVVFNTAMFGYQEILTDPSYAGQMLCFTTPHIGNVGWNEEDFESERVHAVAAIVRDLPRLTSNFRAKEGFVDGLRRAGVPGISGIDTRALVRHLRDNGAQMGALGFGALAVPEELVALAREAGSMEGREYVTQVTTKKRYTWMEGCWELGKGFRSYSEADMRERPHVVVLDCGVKRNILCLLLDAGFRVTVLPAHSSVTEIREVAPDALFLSNGPGDPATLTGIVAVTKELLGTIPIFGICLGHQILAQALGGRTFKLKFGHRGGNHPVREERSRSVEITVQNHGFAVEPESVPKEVEITHVNLNDGTVEGLHAPGARAFSVQHHPEASPGPHDATHLFQRFYSLVTNAQQGGLSA